MVKPEHTLYSFGSTYGLRSQKIICKVDFACLGLLLILQRALITNSHPSAACFSAPLVWCSVTSAPALLNLKQCCADVRAFEIRILASSIEKQFVLDVF